MKPGTRSRAAPGEDISSTAAALKVVLLYAFVAVLWLLLAEVWAARLYRDASQAALVGTITHLPFVVVTSLLLYRLIRRLLDQVLIVARRNLDEQKQKADALQLLGTIADNSPDSIFAKNLDGRYLLFNREAVRLTGKAIEQVLGHDDTDLFAPLQAEAMRAADRRVIAAGQIITYDEIVQTIDGERTYLTTKGPLHDGCGNVIGVFGFAHDMTERQRAQSKLAEQMKELRRWHDLTSGREGRILELKHEVNQLLAQCAQPPRYPSAESQVQAEE